MLEELLQRIAIALDQAALPYILKWLGEFAAAAGGPSECSGLALA